MVDGTVRIVVGSVWCREVGEVVLWIGCFYVWLEMVGHLVFIGLIVIVQTFSQGRCLIPPRM